MMADQGVTTEIKRRLDLVQVISEYVPTKKAGSSFRAVCPFHNEKSPSLFVSPEKQMWHCFGCGEGGDVFAFVMKIEGMEFKDALRHLAKKAGVELTEETRKTSGERAKLIEANTLAMKFWHQVLMKTDVAAGAREYLSKRALAEETIVSFGIGFAPDSWDSLKNALNKKGIDDATLLKAGLVSPREKGPGCFDRFRGRIMFPIRDVHGDVVGFTGRVMPGSDGKDPKDAGKYMNTPQTPLYNKSAVLFCLDRARTEIKRKGFAVVVEGNMDAITSHQAGITNVVASSGTAFTDEQLGLLQRYANKLVLSFDMDAAGELAARRSIDLALQHGFVLRVLRLPPEAGKDPDDCIRKNPAMWTRAIDESVPYMQWYIDKVRGRMAGADPQKKAELSKELLGEIAKIPEPVEQAEWVKVVAAMFGTPEVMLYERLQTLRHTPASGSRAHSPSGSFADARSTQSDSRRTPAALERESPRGRTSAGSHQGRMDYKQKAPRAEYQGESADPGQYQGAPVAQKSHAPAKKVPANRLKIMAANALGMALRWPELAPVLAQLKEDVLPPELAPLYKVALGAYSQSESSVVEQQEITLYLLRAEKDFSDITSDERKLALGRLVTELQQLHREVRKMQLVQLMAHAEKTRDSAQILTIQEELTKLLTQTIQ